MRLRLGLLAFLLLSCGTAAPAAEPRAIIERAIREMGGEDVVGMKAATVVKIRGQIQAAGLTEKTALTGELFQQSTTSRRYDLTIELGGQKLEVTQAMVDGKGWRKLPGGNVEDVTGAEAEEMRELLEQDRASMLVPLLKDKGYTLTAPDDDKVEGRPAFVVKASYKDRPDTLLYFDQKTGLLVKMGFRSRQGKLMETILLDYREVGREDDERAVRAAGIDADARPLLAFLRRQAPDPAKVDRVRELIRKLADDSFEVREQAQKDLLALEKVAVPQLQQAAKDKDAEVARRAGECLEQIEKRTSNTTLLAAVRLVGWTRPDGGAEALLALLPGVEEAVAEAARAALVACSERDGKPDPALVAALDDRDPTRRAAARAVLGKDGGEYLKRPGRALFPRGFRQPTRNKYFEDGKPQFDFEVVELRILNQIDPKVFEKPKGN
jgi:hypothetical protein